MFFSEGVFWRPRARRHGRLCALLGWTRRGLTLNTGSAIEHRANTLIRAPVGGPALDIARSVGHKLPQNGLFRQLARVLQATSYVYLNNASGPVTFTG